MEGKKRHSLGGFAPLLQEPPRLGGGGSSGDNRPKGGDLALAGFWISELQSFPSHHAERSNYTLESRRCLEELNLI